MVLVFVYGTLKSGQRNHHLLEDTVGTRGCKLVGRATTAVEYPLVVATIRYVPFMLYKPGTGHKIKGEIYEVGDSVLADLDQLENHPVLYERQETSIIITDDVSGSLGPVGKEITVQAYFLVQYRLELLEYKMLEEYSDSLYQEKYLANANVKWCGEVWKDVHTKY